MNVNKIDVDNLEVMQVNPAESWNAKKTTALKHLVIKRIACAIIVLLNCAILATVLYFTITHCKIPASVVVITPVAAAAIAAVVSLKFPKLGSSAAGTTNPLSLVGKGLAYLFFGPLMLVAKRFDWTRYHDPVVAQQISGDFANPDNSFADLNKKYHKQWKNIVRYGLIPQQHAEVFLELDRDYKPIKGRFKHTHNRLGRVDQQNKGELQQFENNWADLRSKIQFQFPEIPRINYKSRAQVLYMNLKDWNVQKFEK